MTKKQIDEKIYNYNTFILDKFKDIQAQANSLKNVDKPKNDVAFAKITDAIADVRNAFDKLEELEYEVPDPEEEEESGMAFFGGSSFGEFNRRKSF